MHYLEHQPVLNVEHNLFLVSVVPDEGVYGVTVRHPANQARVGRQWSDRVALNAAKKNTTFFTTARGCRQVMCHELLYLRCLLKVSGSFVSRVLTKPNSCITLSSCLRSSCPFRRNMKSLPLLPKEGKRRCKYMSSVWLSM